MNMAGSRLERIRHKRAGKQGVVYLIIAIVLVIVMVGWGLPLAAQLAGGLIKSDGEPILTKELPPTPPIFSDVPEATYSAKVRVAGYATPGLDVILYLNGAELERKLVSESGTFAFEQIPLTEGENTIYAYAETPGATRSEQSKNYMITVDATKPTVTIDSPKDGDVFRGSSNRIANFSGGVNEEGSKVYIGERMAIVASDGRFSLPYQLIEGDQEIQIRAIDKAGNESVSSIKLRWEP